MPREPREITLDFDGVLNSYVSGYTGVEVVDDPVPGALRFVRALIDDGFDVKIASHRATTKEGAAAIRTWLAERDFPPLKVSGDKPGSWLHIDDRVFRFTGDFDEVLRFIHGKRDETDSWVDTPKAAQVLARRR